MKKFIAILLILATLLSFAGCSYIDDQVEERETKAAADKVIDKIDSLGTITIESRISIEKVEKAYNALTDNAKALVTNYQDLVDARATFLELRKQSIVDRVEEVKAAFAEDYNSRVYFLTLYDIRKDCHEGEFEIVDEAIAEGEALCYKNTHFITFTKYLAHEGSVKKSSDGKKYTYKDPADKKTYKAKYAKISAKRGSMTDVSAYHTYRFEVTGSNKDAAKVWAVAAQLYSSHLRESNTMKEKKIKWGNTADVGQYGIVYVDDLGNELQVAFSNTKYSYYYKVMLKWANQE